MSALRWEYEDLHRLVDRLTPDQARALHALTLEIVRSHPKTITARTESPREPATVAQRDDLHAQT
ncbi:hypothetical protein OIE66_28445 [Nonomuraea sp. NBC_01738]|uniref:hypothetical protein n=1 Tax=Nonomuraea sp. NBC_01738 TaxID=2976003 RepID=UPI002E0F362E|nr:hypothetical protein OIE66_28445 [Nonomuraea sp. NBC_01738]